MYGAIQVSVQIVSITNGRIQRKIIINQKQKLLKLLLQLLFLLDVVCLYLHKRRNTEDAAQEKHVPFCDIEEDMVYVKIGEVDHPMTDEHYIEWVAAVYDDSVLKYNFKPGEVPEAVFDYEEGMVVYAYCNLHGLWKKEM